MFIVILQSLSDRSKAFICMTLPICKFDLYIEIL